MDLWSGYKVNLLKKLRTDMTFLEGVNGKPKKLPAAFKNSEALILSYLKGDLSYSDIELMQSGGARSVEEIWRDFQTGVKTTLKKDATCGLSLQEIDSLNQLPKEFTQNKKYTEWIVRSYIAGGIRHLQDYELVYKYIDKFEKIKTDLVKPPPIDASQEIKAEANLKLKALQLKKPKKRFGDNNILTYCGLIGCNKAGWRMPGLQHIIDEYEEELDNESLIYNGDKIKIYNPKTMEESCNMGTDTKWCTARRDLKNAFENYAKLGSLYIIVPKQPKYPGEKYQFHYESLTYNNENDIPIDLHEFITSYPEMLEIYDTSDSAEAYTLKFQRVEMVQRAQRAEAGLPITPLIIKSLSTGKLYNYFVTTDGETRDSYEYYVYNLSDMQNDRLLTLTDAIYLMHHLEKLQIVIQSLIFQHVLYDLLPFKYSLKRRDLDIEDTMLLYDMFKMEASQFMEKINQLTYNTDPHDKVTVYISGHPILDFSNSDETNSIDLEISKGRNIIKLNYRSTKKDIGPRQVQQLMFN